MDIITRYMDQGLNRAELEQLADALRDDRELAAEFARASRLDQALEETFAEAARESELAGLVAMLEKQDAPPKTIPRIAILAAAAAVVLCFAIIQLWPGDRSADPSSSADARPAVKRIQRPSVHLPQTRLTAILPRAAGTDVEAEARLRQRLSRFYLPSTNIGELPLDEALAALQQSLYKLDQLGWTTDEAVVFEVAKRSDEAGPLPTVSLTRSNISVLNALNLLALQAGLQLSFAPPTIRLVPNPKAIQTADSERLLTNTYSVPPNLFASGPYRESTPGWFSPDGSLVTIAAADGPIRIFSTETGEVMATLDHPPGVEPAEFTAEGELVEGVAPVGSTSGANNQESGQQVISSPVQVWEETRANLAATWRFEISGDGQGGSYFPTTGELVLRSSLADHTRFAALLSEAAGTSASSAPITISTKLINLPPELDGAADRIVNADEWQQILRGWSQTRGVDLLAAPSITARIGTEVSAEILTTRFVEVNQEPGENFGDTSVDRGTALRLPFTTCASGEQITIIGSIEQSMNEDTLSPEMLEQLGGSDPDSPIVHFITDIEAPIFPGQVAIFECEPFEPGRKMIAAVSVSWGAPAPGPAE